MDRSHAMAVTSSANPVGEGKGKGKVYAPSSDLLDVRAYSAPRRNPSTARSLTSTGHPIEVTFNAARPPALSNLSVHCPGLQLPPADLSLVPKVLSADADLILLRVPVDPKGKYFYDDNDYFVYRANHLHPKLDLLPKSCPDNFGDQEIAILSCGEAAMDGDEQKQYVVAALKISPLGEFTFTLHLYHSKPGGEPGRWRSRAVSVQDPQRDKVCPIPMTAQRLMYHITTKVIVIGGAKGTVGWVDLWRGILLCDVLEESPKLQDMPLPLPAKGNWGLFLNGCEYCYRDVTVNRRKDSIKYVEMEIVPPRKVTTEPSRPAPVSYLEWLQRQKEPSQRSCTLVPGRWKATTWSMPIPVASWDDWHLDYTLKLGDLRVDNPSHYELLRTLMSSSGNNQEITEATFSLGCLHMAYPALSIDDDVVYLLTRAATSTRKTGVMIAIDVRRKKLKGVAKLDSKRNSRSFIRGYLACGISKHLKTTGIEESPGQTEEAYSKPQQVGVEGSNK